MTYYLWIIYYSTAFFCAKHTKRHLLSRETGVKIDMCGKIQ